MQEVTIKYENPAIGNVLLCLRAFFKSIYKMKKAKEHASELLVVYADAVMQKNWQLFTKKMSDVFMAVAVSEVQELRKMRNISTDNGLIPIFKEQRQKYGSICKIVNGVKSNLLSITDFDEVIKEIHPSIYDWYVSAVLT